jgi:sortase B
MYKDNITKDNNTEKSVRTIRETVRQHFLLILIIVLALVFIVSAFYLIKYLLDGKKAKDYYKEITPPVLVDEDNLADFEDAKKYYLELKSQNVDFAAWLKILGTSINYPVMYTPNNMEFYLRKNFKKEYSEEGCLFASNISNIDRPSDVITIYGHDMINGTMFGGLRKYKEQTYFKGHQYMILDTTTARKYYRIVAIIRTNVDTGKSDEFKYYNLVDIPTEADYDKYISQVKEKQFYETNVPSQFGDNFLQLSTCDSTSDSARVVVIAKEITYEEWPKTTSKSVQN